MDLKNAAAVCLISFVSATLVVLIARTLDSQAASQLEPQLKAIVAELQAIRKQGGIPAAAASDAPAADTVSDGLVVYYFHGNKRCPTCNAIESQAQEALLAHFGPQVSNGEVVWKVVNFDQAGGKPLAATFSITTSGVVVARMKGGDLQKWKSLDKVWALVGDKPAFAMYVREEIDRMLASAAPVPAADQAKSPDSIPVPE